MCTFFVYQLHLTQPVCWDTEVSLKDSSLISVPPHHVGKVTSFQSEMQKICLVSFKAALRTSLCHCSSSGVLHPRTPHSLTLKPLQSSPKNLKGLLSTPKIFLPAKLDKMIA